MPSGQGFPAFGGDSLGPEQSWAQNKAGPKTKLGTEQSWAQNKAVPCPCATQVNGCLLDPVPPVVMRKGCQSLPSSMMETSIDEGIETEGEAEEDPAQAFAALQAARGGKRRHTLAEVTNQLVMVPGTGTELSKDISQLIFSLSTQSN